MEPFKISIHAPREGRDITRFPTSHHGHIFQSTRPARGATKSNFENRIISEISIHAPREGRDQRTHHYHS